MAVVWLEATLLALEQVDVGSGLMNSTCHLSLEFFVFNYKLNCPRFNKIKHTMTMN